MSIAATSVNPQLSPPQTAATAPRTASPSTSASASASASASTPASASASASTALPASDGVQVDPAAAADATVAQGFGSLLARQLDKGGATDRPDDATRKPVGDASTSDASLLDAGAGVGVAVAVTQAFDRKNVGASASVTGADRDGPSEATTRRPDADTAVAADDLAAQIALASQWTAVAQPRPADGAPTGLDVKGRLDSIRGAASRAVATVDVASGAAPRASDVPAATTVPPTSSSVSTEKDVSSTDLADALLGKVDPAASHRPNETTSFTNAFVTQVAAQVASVATTASSATPPTATLHQPVGTPAWSHELGQVALRLASDDLQGASLRLNPEHLGPLDVQVRIEHGTAHLTFTAMQVETRQAIESSRTTLDQLFSDQGLRVGDVTVDDSSRRGFDGADARAARGGGGGRWSGDETVADEAVVQTLATRVSKALGLVDTFA